MDYFTGSVILFAGNYAPRGWLFCHGQLLSITQNTSLYSILGTAYGGDGKTNFALPDLRGRVPIGSGIGRNLNNYYLLGQTGGVETIQLDATNLPSHTHDINVSAPINLNGAVQMFVGGTPTTDKAEGNYLANNEGGNGFVSSLNSDLSLAADAIHIVAGGYAHLDTTTGSTGLGLSFSPIQPFLAMNYIICSNGVFPSRNP